MTKLEYGDLYKFLVSLGIVLIGLSLVVPWLFLRESFGGELTASDIAQLTPAAQTLLSYRLQAALWFVRNVWWVSAILMIGGLLPLVLGIVLWVRKQRRLDQREQIETQKLGLEVEKLRRDLQPLTPEQIVIKATKEMTEEVGAEEPAQLSVVQSVTTGIQEYLRVEKVFFDKLVTCYGQDRILTQQRARGATYDAVLVADSASEPDVVFEVKRLTRRYGVERVRAAVDQTRRLIQDYAVLRMRSTAAVLGIVMCVVPEHDLDSAMMQQYLWATEDHARLQDINVHAIFITEQQLERITCAELRTKIHGLGGPAQ